MGPEEKIDNALQFVAAVENQWLYNEDNYLPHSK